MKQMNLLKLKFRKRVFRIFQSWYSTKQADFGRKLSVIKRNETRLELAVGGIPNHVMSISFSISGGEPRLLDIAAYFYLNGECMDSTGWFDAQPVRVAEGYRCRICELEGNTKVYPSLEILCEDHLFEPLMAWINETLTNLIRIDFCQTSTGGISWVKFIQDETIEIDSETVASYILPLAHMQMGLER